MEYGTLVLLGLYLALVVAYLISERTHRRERQWLCRALMARHLGQHTYSQVIEAQDKVTRDTHEAFAYQMEQEAPQAPVSPTVGKWPQEPAPGTEQTEEELWHTKVGDGSPGVI